MRTRSEIYKEFEKVHREMNRLERDGLASSQEYYELGLQYKRLEKELAKSG